METRRCGFGFLRQVKARSPVGNTAQTCRCQRCGQLRRGDGVVDSADEFERQGYGRQAARLYFERARLIIHSQRDGSRERFLPEHRRVYRYAGRGI